MPAAKGAAYPKPLKSSLIIHICSMPKSKIYAGSTTTSLCKNIFIVNAVYAVYIDYSFLASRGIFRIIYAARKLRVRRVFFPCLAVRHRA